MFVDQLATPADVTQLVGDIDAQTISRILAIAPTRDELARAVHDVDVRDDDLHDQGLDDEPGTPSSERVASIRRMIAQLHERGCSADAETCVP